MNVNMSRVIFSFMAASCLSMCSPKSEAGTGADKQPRKEITKKELIDKIKGGWAGQTIGVTLGWPSEFRYLGTYIQDYETIRWHDDYVNEAMTTFPGLYDDVYVDLTFVEVFEKLGINAPLDSFAAAFKGKQYDLWHANQAGRYNLQQGVSADRSGHWLQNPHADDIDFQIESDFAGLMSPGMPGAATTIANRLGRLVNSGDGLYGGIYVANLYALAFANDNVPFIVKEALKAIPAQSKFHQCISDVIMWHAKYPADWKQTWFEVQKKWAEENGCPNGVFNPLNIDAKLNAAYVVIGLLYGNGDFTKTLEVATRLGQDSDCNPATAAGVLGVIKGYSNIPAYWLTPLQKAEQRNFSFTNISLEKVYQLGYKHAMANIAANNGDTTRETITFPQTALTTVPFEENFAGHYPQKFIPLGKTFSDEFSFEVEGIGFVIRGHAAKKVANAPDHTLKAALYIDGREVETASFPVNPINSRTELFWRYQMPAGKHQVQIKVINPNSSYEFRTVDCLVYGDKKNIGARK